MSNFSMTVEEHATSPVLAVRPEARLPEVVALMTERGVSSVAVTDGNNRLLGVVSRTDLLRVARRIAAAAGRPGRLEVPDQPVAPTMTTEVVTCSPSTEVGEAARSMLQHRIHRVFVVDGAELSAVFTTRDVMDAIVAKRLNKPLSEFMSSPLFTVRAADPMSLATERLEKAHVRGLVVLDGDWPVGVFTQRESLRGKDLPPDTSIEEIMSPAILLLDESTPLHRAAAQARATRVRRVVALRGGRPAGILSGLDFARAAA
jgi:CBS domain-containing protein